MRAAVFFERDGVLARSAINGGTAKRLEEFQVLEDASAPLRQLKDAGFFLFATTNQPGVTSGLPSRRELDLMHAVLVRRLGLHEVLVCPHPLEDACPCRKPSPELLREAARRHGVDLDHSFVVSDRWVDAEMAEAAGATSVLIRSKHNGNGHHDCVVSDLQSAVEKILEIARDVGTLRAMSAQKR
ncbi:MAG: HAD-IIIA family hydrolase [Verrucomicrobiales bacterium]|nr:HAD-IIIA family hydrolase [Verrucomicrobiales bacterium]